MKPYVSIVVPGDPIPKGRPRFARVGAKVRTYTPAKTRTYEAELAWRGRLAMKGRALLEGPVRLVVRAYFAMPKSLPLVRQKAALTDLIRPTHKADGDNILKIVGDGLNGIIWLDDAQIVEAFIGKHYSTDPRITIDVFQEGI